MSRLELKSHTMKKLDCKHFRNPISSTLREYLTGFQKRNQLKKAKAIEYQKSLERREKIELRKQKSESLKDKKAVIAQDLERIESIQSLGKKLDHTRELKTDQKVFTVTVTEYDLEA